MLVVATMVPLR